MTLVKKFRTAMIAGAVAGAVVSFAPTTQALSTPVTTAEMIAGSTPTEYVQFRGGGFRGGSFVGFRGGGFRGGIGGGFRGFRGNRFGGFRGGMGGFRTAHWSGRRGWGGHGRRGGWGGHVRRGGLGGYGRGYYGSSGRRYWDIPNKPR